MNTSDMWLRDVEKWVTDAEREVSSANVVHTTAWTSPREAEPTPGHVTHPPR
ncbi:hypothetical protein UO65_1476 [Actinokineospora spheciospongiae]|uniref:Uncharacterized protein n=1 Tax=Actinokineospora spheciospongiae TaxID=909613 RepID=W7J2G8_9PSEU|nr:hypothetical protein [Actinokineospora spheciospongiae]EWC63262.1 hypothetical protein UO65_1476 [Actinokineospora spheciospongiae]PWW66908.1 hypothetical protein DFQ13_101426 [Actinokineospora spheciospongiae]